jgi:hypothetical protein
MASAAAEPAPPAAAREPRFVRHLRGGEEVHDFVNYAPTP